MDFGELRSLVARVREQRDRVDELVYMLLQNRGDERFEHNVTYALDNLRETAEGSVGLADLVSWALAGVEPLYERLGDGVDVSGGIVEEFLAGWAWAVVRRPGKAPYGVIEDARGHSGIYMYGSPTDAWEMRATGWSAGSSTGLLECWDITVDDANWGGPPELGRSSCKAKSSTARTKE